MYKLIARTHKIWGKLIPSFYYPYKIPGGRCYLNITESVMMLNRAVGKFEVGRHEAIQKFLERGDIFIDIGACKGDYTLLASSIVGEKGRVLSFEPEPTNRKWLLKSVNLNGYTNITIYETALSNSNGKAQFYLGKKSGWHSLIPDLSTHGKGVIPITVRTLDDVIEEFGINGSVNMIKVDVEGSEMQVLEGASRTLDQHSLRTVLVDMHPMFGVNPYEVCKYLEGKGFVIYHEIPPFSTTVTEYANLTEIVARREKE